MDKDPQITALQQQLQKEQEGRQSLEKFVELQTEEMRRLKRKIEDLLLQNLSVPVQNFESFLDGPHSFDVDQYKVFSAIKERNEFIQLVLDTSPNFICVRDASGNIKLINKSFAEVLFRKDREKLKQAKVSDFYSKQEEKEFFLKTERQVIEEQREIVNQEIVTDPDGGVIILKTIRKPLVTDDGQVYVLGISTDITEQVRAKEKLQHKEELYRLLSENSKDIIGLFDKNLNRIYVSPAVQKILGFLPDELINKTWLDFVHPDDRGYFNKKLESVIHGHQDITLQFRYLKKDGNYLWMESQLHAILDKDGQLEKIQASTRDITSRKVAQKALKDSEKKYKDLVKYSQAYIFTHDLKGNLLSANPSFCRMLGTSTRDLLGKNIKQFITEQPKGGSLSYLQKFQNELFVEGIFEAFDSNGEKHYMVYDSFLVEESVDSKYVICNAQDITDRILAEKELKKAKKVAEESVKLNDKFLASMTHEIRTPMQGIMGVANLLNKTKLDETQQHYLDVIRQSSDYLLVIINEILDFNKIKEGKVELEKIPFDINEVVDSAYNMLELKAKEKGLAFEVENIPVDSQLIGDPFRLNQILLNLLNNGIKFTERGGVFLKSKIIDETSSKLTIEFSVNDTGIGIARENLEKIFEEFSQASSDTTRKFGGTGLGLNICQNLINRQNGRIWVESEPGKGSSFKFTLSFDKDNGNIKAAGKRDYEIDYTALGQLNVLLAEDNKVNVVLAKTYMSRWDFKMDIAYNGQEAVALAKKYNYDIILMDIQMPLLDGYGATKIIRQFANKEKANTPIIALTANALKKDAEKYIAGGMDDYLSKPFTEEALYLKIAEQFSIDPRVKKQDPPSDISEQQPAIADNKALSQEFNLKFCDFAYLERIACGDISFIRELVMLFLKQSLDEVRKIEAALVLNDLSEIKSHAHKMKSSASMIGADKMRTLLIQMERLASSDPEQEKMQRVYNEFKLRYDQVSGELQELLQQL